MSESEIPLEDTPLEQPVEPHQQDLESWSSTGDASIGGQESTGGLIISEARSHRTSSKKTVKSSSSSHRSSKTVKSSSSASSHEAAEKSAWEIGQETRQEADAAEKTEAAKPAASTDIQAASDAVGSTTETSPNSAQIFLAKERKNADPAVSPDIASEIDQLFGDLDKIMMENKRILGDNSSGNVQVSPADSEDVTEVSGAGAIEAEGNITSLVPEKPYEEFTDDVQHDSIIEGMSKKENVIKLETVDAQPSVEVNLIPEEREGKKIQDIFATETQAPDAVEYVPREPLADPILLDEVMVPEVKTDDTVLSEVVVPGVNDLREDHVNKLPEQPKDLPEVTIIENIDPEQQKEHLEHNAEENAAADTAADNSKFLEEKPDEKMEKPKIEVFEDASYDKTTGVKSTTKVVTSQTEGQSEDASKKWKEATEERVETKTSPESKELTSSAKKEALVVEKKEIPGGSSSKISKKTEQVTLMESKSTKTSAQATGPTPEKIGSKTAQDFLKSAEEMMQEAKAQQQQAAAATTTKQAASQPPAQSSGDGQQLKSAEELQAEADQQGSLLSSMTSALSSSFSYMTSVFSSSSRSCTKSSESQSSSSTTAKGSEGH